MKSMNQFEFTLIDFHPKRKIFVLNFFKLIFKFFHIIFTKSLTIFSSDEFYMHFYNEMNTILTKLIFFYGDS